MPSDDNQRFQRNRKMFVKDTFRRLALLAVGLALLLPGSIVSSQKQKHREDKQTPPEGIPVIWQAPSDIATRDLYWGQGGKTMQPDLSRVTLIKKEPGGYSTK